MGSRFVAIDPGVTSGYALFDEGKPLHMGEVTTEKDLRAFNEWLDDDEYNDIEVWVVEDYIIRIDPQYKGFNHRFDQGIALRVIGAITHRAYGNGGEVVLQQPSILPIAAGRIGFPYNPKKHVQNQHSAILHGMHYWLKEHPDAAPQNDNRREDSSGDGVRPTTRVSQISGWERPRGKRGRPKLGM